MAKIRIIKKIRQRSKNVLHLSIWHYVVQETKVDLHGAQVMSPECTADEHRKSVMIPRFRPACVGKTQVKPKAWRAESVFGWFPSAQKMPKIENVWKHSEIQSCSWMAQWLLAGRGIKHQYDPICAYEAAQIFQNVSFTWNLLNKRNRRPFDSTWTILDLASPTTAGKPFEGPNSQVHWTI